MSPGALALQPRWAREGNLPAAVDRVRRTRPRPTRDREGAASCQTRTHYRAPAGPAAPAAYDETQVTRGSGAAGILVRTMRLAPRLRVAAALHRLRAGVARLARAVSRLLPPRGRDAATRPLTDYKAPNYWLDYRFGFVRRGLPGEVLRRVVKGPPRYRQVEATAVGLSRAAALSVVPMALQAARRAPRRLPRVVATALLVLSPLTCSLLLHDIGRYDAVGVLVLALLAGARSAWLRLPLPVGAVLLAAAVCLAAATEEFLLAVVAPAAMAAVTLLAAGRELCFERRLLLLGVVLGPGAVVAGASLLVPAPRAALLAARDEATRAGVGLADAMGDSLAALDRGLVENLAFFRLFEPTAVTLSLALWAGLYVITTAVLRRLLGAGRPYRSLVAVHALVGAALCTVATDFRRWWGLALLGLVATVVLLEPAGLEEPVTLTAVAGAAVLALAGLGLREAKVYPSGRLRLDRSLPATL